MGWGAQAWSNHCADRSFHSSKKRQGEEGCACEKVTRRGGGRVAVERALHYNASCVRVRVSRCGGVVLWGWRHWRVGSRSNGFANLC